MIDLLRSEWIKLRSVRSNIVVLLLAGGLVVLVAVIAIVNLNDEEYGFECVMATDAQGQPVDAEPNGFCSNGGQMVQTEPSRNLTDVTPGVSIAAILFGVIGVQVIGQEYRFNTIRSTFAAAPRRIRVLVAKLVVVSLATALVAAVMVALCHVLGVAMLDGYEVDGVDQRAALGVVLFSVGWCAIGMAVGAILRQPIAAIPVLLGEAFVAESIVGSLIDGTGPWLPFQNGFQMTLRVHDNGMDLRTVLGGGIYFGIVAVVLWAVGAYLVQTRDA